MKISEIYNDEKFNILTTQISSMWESGFPYNLKRKINGNRGKINIDAINSIKEARNLYHWRYSVKPENDNVSFKIKGNSFEDSMAVLSYAKELIISNNNFKNEDLIKEGTRLIFQWGGVYKAGNRKKTNDNNYSLKNDYAEVDRYWKEILAGKHFDLSDNFNFESNAGFTKVYSLILEDFIIYDSRVSVALAYLIEKILGHGIPDYLKLFIPPSYAYGDAKNKRAVNPIFKPTNSNKKRHFYSNIISNLILKSVHNNIKQKAVSTSLRDIEAALFMIGYDIRE